MTPETHTHVVNNGKRDLTIDELAWPKDIRRSRFGEVTIPWESMRG